MKKLLLLFFFSPWLLFAQKHDNVWLHGYSSTTIDSDFGGTRIEFNDIQSPEVFYEYREMNFRTSSAAFSTDEGELLLYTNNIYVANGEHEEIEGSYGLGPGGLFSNHESGGSLMNQGALILKRPDSDSEYFLFHTNYIDEDEFAEYYSSKIFYSIIDMSVNDGSGLMLEKNAELNSGLFGVGQITATKHANGRDWWIIHSELSSNAYFIYLFTNLGVQLHSMQELGPVTINGLGQSMFSPDGTKYVRYQGYDINGPHHLVIYDFDRCTGELSFIAEDYNTHFSLVQGMAISPNSRFIYCSSFEYIFQYDMWADDIPASKLTIAEYDGFTDQFGLPVNFWQAQLAPDEKIYIACQGAVPYMHIIHYPNKPGILAEVEQHSLELPTYNAYTMPNNPNYRLGPLDGSSCDTLGIDNFPICDFRYVVDTSNAKKVEFTEVTHYEPTEWFWDFGDGESSTALNPVHQYESGGTYEVCLSVSNEYGSDSKCRTIQIITTNTQDLWAQQAIKSLPNPATHFVYLQMERPLPQGALWQLTNLQGRVVQKERVAGSQRQRIDLADLPAGVYFQSIRLKDEIIWRERTVVIK